VAGAEALQNRLHGSIFPNRSGKYAPKCTRVEIQDNWQPDRSLVIADYETPRVVGEGTLRIQSMFQSDPTTVDLEGAVITGLEKHSTKLKTYQERRLVSGSAIKPRPFTKVILETAATSLDINYIMSREGCVNRYRLPNFGNAAPGTMLFLGAPESSYKLTGGLWYLNLAFLYSGPVKWNEQTKSVAGNYFPLQRAALDKDKNVVAGSKVTILQWLPNEMNTDGSVGADSTPSGHQLFAEADFRDLGKHLVITGIA